MKGNVGNHGRVRCRFIQKLNFSSKAAKLSASKTFRLISIWFSFVLETCGKSESWLFERFSCSHGRRGCSRVMRHNLLFCLVLIMAGRRRGAEGTLATGSQ